MRFLFERQTSPVFSESKNKKLPLAAKQKKKLLIKSTLITTCRVNPSASRTILFLNLQGFRFYDKIFQYQTYPTILFRQKKVFLWRDTQSEEEKEEERRSDI